MMRERKLRIEIDYSVIVISLFLLVYGIVTIAGATMDDPNPLLRNVWKKQMISVFIGLAAGTLLVFLNYRKLLDNAYTIYAFSLGMLMLVWAPHIGHQSHGAHSWIKIPMVGFQIQPSEFAKLALILVLARHLSAREGKFESIKQAIPALILALVPCMLVLVQPDLGTAFVFPLLALGMLYAAGFPAVRILLLCSPALAAVPPMLWRLDETITGPACFFSFLILMAVVVYWNYRLKIRWIEIVLFGSMSLCSFLLVSYSFEDVWNQLRSHQQERILTFLHPEGTELESGWQVNQSKIAIGNGGLTGQGWRQGTQNKNKFMSEKHNDFIFSILAEERGFVGCLVLLGAFGLLFFRGMVIAGLARHFGGALLAAGIVIMFASYLFLNLGICMGMFPVTGIPLLMISYGGSAVMSSIMAIALLVSIRLYRYA
jgi:rod shape determining protein RodA